MESMVPIGSLQDMEQELSELEQMIQSDSKAVLERIGEKLAGWEHLIRSANDYPSALRVGFLLEKVKQYWFALSWYQWVAASDEKSVSRALMTEIIHAKGRVYIRLGMNKEALALLKRAKQRLQQDNSTDDLEYPLVLHNLSLLYGRFEQRGLELQYAISALKWYREHEDHARASIAEFSVGSTLSVLKRYDEAYEYLTRARDGLEEVKDYFYLARCWHNYAELMRDTGRMEEALAAWRMSLEMKKRTEDYFGQVNTLLSISKYLSSQNDWYSALSYVTQAISMCHQYRLYDLEVSCLEQWSIILTALGKHADLEVCAARLMCLAQSVSTQHQVTALLQRITEEFQHIGRSDLAEQYSMNAV